MTKITEKYTGWIYRILLDTPSQKDMLDLIFTTDDGTWGDHFIVKLNEVPYSVIPYINEKNLEKIIDILQRVKKEKYGKSK